VKVPQGFVWGVLGELFSLLRSGLQFVAHLLHLQMPHSTASNALVLLNDPSGQSSPSLSLLQRPCSAPRILQLPVTRSHDKPTG
jgi:hypothetical protein